MDTKLPVTWLESQMHIRKKTNQRKSGQYDCMYFFESLRKEQTETLEHLSHLF